MDTHRRLKVWQHARELVALAYQLTRLLPPDERFVATTQLRRAAWSVHNNLAEGNAKLGRAEMRRFFDIALGSLAELDAMVVTLGDLYNLDPAIVGKVDEARRAITGQIFGILKAGAR